MRTFEGLLESRWSLVAAVKFISGVLDMTDTDALCSFAVIKINQELYVGRISDSGTL